MSRCGHLRGYKSVKKPGFNRVKARVKPLTIKKCPTKEIVLTEEYRYMQQLKIQAFSGVIIWFVRRIRGKK